MQSSYLDRVLNQQNRATILKVVFVDIVSYSKRRVQAQAQVIEAFMRCLRTAHEVISQKYVNYAQKNNLNFKTDVILLPSGDGAAVAFPFQGLHEIHLDFAKEILCEVHAHNESEGCEKFASQGWCHCHSSFDLAVGVSDGDGILYRDVNDGYNIAGTVINMAGRVMGVAGARQILFTKDAYTQLINMVDDAFMDEKFRAYPHTKVKHGVDIDIYQYCEEGLDYLNTAPPEKLEFVMKASDTIEKLNTLLGFPMLMKTDLDKDVMLGAMEAFVQALGDLDSALSPAALANADAPTRIMSEGYADDSGESGRDEDD